MKKFRSQDHEKAKNLRRPTYQGHKKADHMKSHEKAENLRRSTYQDRLKFDLPRS